MNQAGHTRIGKGLIIFIAVWLSACSSISQKPQTQQDAARQQALGEMQNWRLRGKLGFKVPRQSGTAFIDWKQTGDSFRIHLSGPLGQGSTAIESDGKTITMRQNGQQQQGLAQQQDFIKQQLGWDLPIQQLRYWVLGLSSPDSEANALYHSKTGLLSNLEQDQWSISYPRYSRHRLPLPEKIVLRRANPVPSSQDTKLTLIIKRWN